MSKYLLPLFGQLQGKPIGGIGTGKTIISLTRRDTGYFHRIVIHIIMIYTFSRLEKFLHRRSQKTQIDDYPALSGLLNDQ